MTEEMQEEREEMELDVLFVGAGLANLTTAYRLMKNIEAHNEKGESQIEEPMVLVIDKAANVGNHSLSGAVADPKAFNELFPDEDPENLPLLTPVTGDKVYFLTKGGKIPVPGLFLPGPMHNKSSFYIASLAEMTRWMAEKCEEVGVEVMTEFSAMELLKDGDKVIGARMGDKGLEHDGSRGETFALGEDLLARVTVLGEGTRGYLSRQLIEDMKLDADSNPQVWGVGVKEIIEIPEGRIQKGNVIHTFGYPLDFSTYGGSFCYAIDDNKIALGLVMGLDYRNPLMETHNNFLRLKKHPLIADLIKGGKVLEYGAKTLPEGGYYGIPKLAVDGAVMVGDSAGFINMMRLKGLHLAMKSGILAADKLVQALADDDMSAAKLDYRKEFDESWAGEEMYSTRNFRQGFHGGLIPGMLKTGMWIGSLGKLPGGRSTMPADHETLDLASQGKEPEKVSTDEELYLDLLTDVYKSGSLHREEQPTHCKILDVEKCKECYEKYQAPCARFCPAKVYEIEMTEDGKFDRIQINFSNCVHCKTCEIKDPLRNIAWLPPEGGDGPKYQKM